MKPTPRTDKAAYKYPKETSLEDRDGVRWCNLLNESRKLEDDLSEAITGFKLLARDIEIILNIVTCPECGKYENIAEWEKEGTQYFNAKRSIQSILSKNKTYER